MIRGLKFVTYGKIMKKMFPQFWKEKLREDFTVVFSNRRRIEEKK